MIDIHGGGCATGKLIEIAERIVKDAKIIYQNIWVVFDKDDFECWLYLHFYYSDSALHRDDWNKKLDNIFEQYQLGDGTYQKNYKDIYNLVNSFDGMNTAIKNAKRRMALFRNGVDKPSEYDPGTMVYKLVQELKVYLDEE